MFGIFSLLLCLITRSQIPDASFSSDGEAGPLPSFSSYSGEQQSMAIQADGKIVIAGWYRFDDGSRAFAAMRLNSDGSLDGAFNPNFGADASLNHVLVLNDGKILAGGLPVEAPSFCDQLEKRQAERQPMHSIWSVRISRLFSGVTKMSVDSGVRIASVKPSAIQPSACSLSAEVT